MKAQTLEGWEDQPRVDSREKVTGAARFVEDLPDLPGTVFGAALFSPYAHARIVAIDSSRAARLPGVVGVLDRERLEGFDPNLPAARQEFQKLSSDETFIALDKVRFDGELVAMAVAEDLRTAREAVGLIDVRYEVLPAVFSAAEALAPGAPILHERKGTNLLLEDGMEWGDVETGLREADQVFDETFTSPSMFHHPMENVGGCLAQFLGEEVNLWFTTSSPFANAQAIARVFGLEPERVRVRVAYVGGSFGSKGITHSVWAALFLARKTGRPVRLLPSIQESFRQTSRHAVVYKAKVGVKSDGTLTALDVDLLLDTGAYTTAAATCTHNAVISGWGCYRVPHLRVRGHCAYTNKVPATHTRATGKVQTTWGIESAIDGVARRMGIDPVEFRRKNVLRRGEFVAKGTPLMDTDYLELMERARTAIGWTEDSPGGAGAGGVGPGRFGSKLARGRGVALGLRHGSQGGTRTYAMASMDGRGVVKISHNAPDPGQGIYNLLGVVASRTLAIPQDQIEVGRPDTALSLPFAGVNAQRATMQMGKAVQNACENLKRELVAAACQTRGGTPEEWEIREGRLWRAENGFPYAEIVRGLGGGAVLKSIGFHSSPPKQEDSPFRGMDHWAPSAGAVEVEVDPETGEFRVLQFSVVVDAGKALHYLSAKSQADGGAVMGFSHALFEEVVYEGAQMLNGDPFQYRLAVMQDIPERFHSFMIENGDGPGPFGSKGMSQTSIVTVAPAIGNAIYDAIGVRVRSLPITPEKIVKALNKL